MRTLFVCSRLGVGGFERQWSILIPPLHERGFDVSVLTLREEGRFFEELREQGIPTTCAQMRRRTDLAGLRKAFRLRSFKPHLVVTQSPNAHIVGHLIARRVRASHIATEHFNVGPGAPTRAYREALTRLVAPRVDQVIAISRAQLPRLCRLGYPSHNIRIIPNAVPQPRTAATASSVRSQLGIRRDEFVAVLVAMLRPEKRVDIFIHAIQEAQRVDPRIRGLIVGPGPEFNRLKALAGDDGRVQLLGERFDGSDIVNAADVCCLSSNAEGLPMALLEAMALGKPVVATDVGGVSDAVEHGKTGLLVPTESIKGFGDALIRLASDRRLCQQFGRFAKERHDTLFSVERMLGNYEEAFVKVVHAKKRLNDRKEV